MKQRKLIIGLLVILAVAVSGFTFAFWSSVNLEDSVETTTVTIGEGRQATVTAALNASGTGTLVPENEAVNSVSSNPVESITFTFNVDWTDNGFTGGTADLAVVVDNVSNATADGLLNFSVTGTPLTITEGTQLVVSIVVTLTAPNNVTEYNAIINEAVTFDVTFTVSNPTAA